MVVLFDSARSAEPPQSSGMTGPRALSTLPLAARVDRSLPASKTGSAASTPSGSAPLRMRSSSFLRSALAAAQASKSFCQAACASLPRSTALRVWAMMSSATTKVSAGSKPSTFLTAASSSAPSADPWILPVFCLVGDGQPMIVFRMISDGLSVTPCAASMAAYSSCLSSTYSPVFFQSTVCTCQPYAS